MRHLLVALMILASAPIWAGEKTGPIVQTITHTIRVPEGGTLAEGVALSNEWRAKVLDKNPHMASVTYLGRVVDEHEYKLLVLYEYASAEEQAKARAAFPALMAAAWPGEGGPQHFLEKLWKYIDRRENVSHQYEVVARSK